MTDARKPLETVLADAFAEADVLDRNGAAFAVERVRAMLAEVKGAAEDYITWLSEADAAIRRGVSRQTMASYYPAMERDGNARAAGKERQYRQCAVPRRADTQAAATRARAAARQVKKAS